MGGIMSSAFCSMASARRFGRCLLAALLVALATTGCGGSTARPGPTISIAADARAEQQLLAHLTAQFLQDRGYSVEIEAGLQAEWMVRRALEAGSVDLAWQETGRVWHTYLNHDMPVTDEAQLYRQVRDEDRLNGIIWLTPCAWSARMSLLVTNEMAAVHRLATVGDLAQHISRTDPDLVLCAPEELYASTWGIRGLERVYGFRFQAARVRYLTHEEAYAELLTGACDVALGYGKDVAAYDGALVALRDALAFFPASSLAPTIHASLQSAYPELERLLAELTAALDSASLASMEQQVASGAARPERLAQRFLKEAGLLAGR
jgi:osmoprotectant transport system substrate-binding protein